MGEIRATRISPGTARSPAPRLGDSSRNVGDHSPENKLNTLLERHCAMSILATRQSSKKMRPPVGRAHSDEHAAKDFS
jgi:hypothetical protein